MILSGCLQLQCPDSRRFAVILRQAFEQNLLIVDQKSRLESWHFDVETEWGPTQHVSRLSASSRGVSQLLRFGEASFGQADFAQT